MRLRLILAGFALAGFASPSIAQQASTPTPYTLGVEDKLRIKIFDWRQSVGEVHEWSSVGGDFTVGPAGTISVPLLGEIPAAGLDAPHLAASISARLQAKVGLAQPPDTSIEILRYRPFYILGAVDKPGEYPYRPDLTVLKATSIAGGLFRPADTAYSQLLSAAISTTGDLQSAQSEIDSLRARRARLQAELDDAPKISFPVALLQRRDEPAVARLLQDEQTAFDTRRSDSRAEIDAVARYKDLLRNELTSLHAKAGDEDRELTLIGGELQRVTTLVGKGLAVAPREFSLRQDQIEIQSRRTDLDTAQLRAHEEVGKSDQRLLDLEAQWHNQILQELQTTQTQLNKLEVEARTNGKLLAADAAEGSSGSMENAGDRARVTYSLVRRVGAETRETVVPETAPVEPGDVVKVRRVTGGEPEASQSLSAPTE
jgi:polysaccharide biosynthesis/export protein ExoF